MYISQEQNTINAGTRSHRLPCTCLAMQRVQKDKKVGVNHQIREIVQGRVYCLVKWKVQVNYGKRRSTCMRFTVCAKYAATGGAVNVRRTFWWPRGKKRKTRHLVKELSFPVRDDGSVEGIQLPWGSHLSSLELLLGRSIVEMIKSPMATEDQTIHHSPTV